jgi:predicted nucleic acid-binding protein
MRELSAHPDPVALALLQTAMRDQWIKPAVASDSHLLKVLLRQLHAGEAEAISLAAELQADIVLIDEQEGRQLASHASLSVIGVVGILLRAKHTGQLAVIKPEIDALRSKARFFISASLEAKALAAAGE